MAEIVVGFDGLCTCHCGDKCVVTNKTGMMNRCTAEEIELAGYRTKIIEEKFPQNNKIKREITSLVLKGIYTDGAHHKQWCLECIAQLMGIEICDHEPGIAP